MRKTWVEIQCDYCGNAFHLPPGNISSSLRENGWIVTSKGKDYCSKSCHYIANPRKPKKQPRYVS